MDPSPAHAEADHALLDDWALVDDQAECVESSRLLWSCSLT